MGRLLVTGASGLLGSAVARAAFARGIDVVGTYNEHAPSAAPFEMVALSLTQTGDVERLVRDVGAEAVIHCAALTNVDHCEDRPQLAERVNGEATGALARSARAEGAAFLYVSSDGVFDGTRGWYAEADEPQPVNVYAASKRQGELETLSRHPLALVARLAPFGRSPRPEKPSLADWMLGELAAGRQINGFVDAVFTPLYTQTLAALFLEMIALGLQGTYHLGSRDACSKAEFARGLALRAGYDAGLVASRTLASHAFRARRPGNVSLDTTKAAADIGRPMPTLAGEIDRLLHDTAAGQPV